MFVPARAGAAPSKTVPLLVSRTLHVGVIFAGILITSLGLAQSVAMTEDRVPPEKLRLVFLAQPGPGGGGGGGGLLQRRPPPRARRLGERKLDSPLPARTPPPPPPEPVQKPEDKPEPAVLEAEKLPPIIAPVVISKSGPLDRPGVLEDTKAENDSRGSGAGGGVGTGQGSGIGEGQGPGLGEGSGGGTGGGPYRPGSGITPPRLLKEVRPEYTEEARQRSLEGEVILEIVVRRDGSVGEVRVLQGLGAGLNERAVQAVRQWRFTPARRQNAPVDVVVEVAVDFRLR
jgi:TonB family protein